jgi:Ca2+/Na+ antiporter
MTHNFINPSLVVCVALFVGFSDDRQFFVLVLILFVFFVLLLILIVVRSPRRQRIADNRAVDQPGGTVLGDVRSHVSSCLDVETLARILKHCWAIENPDAGD